MTDHDEFGQRPLPACSNGPSKTFGQDVAHILWETLGVAPLFLSLLVVFAVRALPMATVVVLIVLAVRSC